MEAGTHLSFHPLLSYGLVAAVGLGLLAFSVFAYARTHREIPVAGKVLLLSLRVLAILAILVCLLRPSLTRVEILVEKGMVILILDHSRSLLVRDMDGDRSRAEAVQEALRREASLLDKLGEEYRFERILLGREARPWDSRDLDWSDKATAIGTALDQARLLSRGRKVAGILLLSDGSNNHGPDPVQSALGFRDLASPLYVFGVGRESGFKIRDARAVQILAPRKVFSGNQFPVEAEVQAFGMQGETLEALFSFDGQDIHREKLVLNSEAEDHTLRFNHRAVLPGSHTLRITIPVSGNEISDRNNEASTFVEVLTGGLNVLYLEGKLRPEFGFLRRSLESSQNLALTSPLPHTISTPQRLERFLQSQDLPKYQVVILGDIPASLFPAETLEELRRMVGERGAGMALLGGYDSLGPGGYATSPLADILPFEVSSRDGQADGPVPVRLTAEGRSHFIMALESDPDASAAAWSALPPLLGVTQVGAAKPASRILAESEMHEPLFAVQEYGKGRVAAFLGDTTYRWVLGQPPETAARHKRFWRQVVLWLASRDKQDQKTVLLSTDKLSYSLGESVRILVEVLDKKGNGCPDAEVRVTVEPDEGGTGPLAIPASFQKDHYEAGYTPAGEGAYKITAAAVHQDLDIGKRDARIHVAVPDREFDAPYANLKLLRRTAEAAGGSFHPIEELPRVLQEILDKQLSTEIPLAHHRDVWDTYPVFTLFVLALVLEWTIRRQKGLV
ncbi:MAG: hypothetical protein HYU36_16100 [Planctomycetes bacterium]|nr:hypothetical protein [Planctomycetota bacterium]